MPESPLQNIIEPDSIPFSFDAPGWYVLACILLVMTIALVIYQIIRYRKNKYRRDAYAWLSAIENDNQLNLQEKVLKVNRLLKAIALQLFNRHEVASLEGDQWFEFLNQQLKKACFEPTTYQSVAEGLYRSQKLSPGVTQAFINQSKYWINNHVI
jgi:hypothetical protein